MNIIRIGGIVAGGNIILVTTDSGATVYATNGIKTISGIAVDGVAKLKAKAGTWRVWAELNGDTTSEVEVVVTDSYNMEMSFGLKLSSLPVGTFVRIKENGADVNYRVVHQGLPSSLYDSSCDGTWLMREQLYAQGYFDGTDNDYKSSDMHTYLNSTVLGLFDANTQGVIKQAKIPYFNGAGNSGAVASGANGLSTKIFALSGYELGITTSTNSALPVDGACLSYFNGTAATDSKRIAYNGGTAAHWWSRSPYVGQSKNIFYVSSSGQVTVIYFPTTNMWYRPVMILDSKAVANPEPNADGSYTLMV